MLVDAAKHGDVEIPVFCYEPKLGNPVGACRMCLVEIEGIPKLQTGCSTPVQGRHGRQHPVRAGEEAQRSVVEFLLINHPLDCPVCDKGGRVPAAGHHVRLGSRHLAVRRAQAPLRQAARALPHDRDRPRALHPLLPLRALQPGDLRRPPARAAGARRALLRLDVRRPPVRGAVQRQHRRTVPRRRADLAALPLPGAPVGHRGRGLGLHAVPVPVQRHADRPRRARAARAGARAPRGGRRLAVRPRSLRLPGARRRRPASPSRCCATVASCAPSPGSARWRRPPRGLARAGERTGALVGGGATNEEGLLLARLMREGLGSPHLDSRRAGTLPLESHRALCRPAPAGEGQRPGVRPRRARARLRPDRGRADPRPAPAQGRAPPRHAPRPARAPRTAAR